MSQNSETSDELDEHSVEETERPSKSEIKREFHALQQLAERLVKLSPEHWQQFQFGQSMLEALEESRRVKGNNALRRYIRRLGKLLREEDAELVKSLFARMDNEHMADTQRLHTLEHWRERLLTEGDRALEALLEQVPRADRQHLRQLIRAGRRERSGEHPPAAQRKLFRYLRELFPE